MCTASWWFSNDDGYELFFNRDEQKTRAHGEAPEIRECEGMRYLAPLDPKHGGTWLAVNELGLACCLINHYPPGRLPAAGRLSRGQLVLQCIASHDTAAAAAHAASAALENFAPFHLLALAPGDEPRLLTWDGCELLDTPAGATSPVTSSSFDTRAAIAARHDAYAAVAVDAALDASPSLAHASYHDRHDPTNGAHSVFMNRPGACTVSQTRVAVNASHVSIAYRPIDWNRPDNAPAAPGPFVRHALPRRQRAVVS